MRFELGEVLKDKVTGFQGVALARTEYFTDCTHYGLCSQELKEGKPMGWEWIDETRLVKVKSTKKIVREPRTSTSGIFPSPPQQ